MRFIPGILIATVAALNSNGCSFEGEFSDVSRSYAGKGVVRYAW
jgi:hypothetical protein